MKNFPACFLSLLIALCSAGAGTAGEPDGYPVTGPVLDLVTRDTDESINNQVAVYAPELDEFLLVWSRKVAGTEACSVQSPNPADPVFKNDHHMVLAQRFDARTLAPKSEPLTVLDSDTCDPVTYPGLDNRFIRSTGLSSLSVAWNPDKEEYLSAWFVVTCSEGEPEPPAGDPDGELITPDCSGAFKGNVASGVGVVGAIIEPNGDDTAIGSPFSIDANARNNGGTASAYIDATYGYAVFWSRVDDVNARHIKSLGAAQAPDPGETRTLAVPSDTEFSQDFEPTAVSHPAVAVDRSNNNRMLLAFNATARRKYIRGNETDGYFNEFHFRSNIYGRIIERDLAPVSDTAVFRISDMEIRRPDPDDPGEFIFTNPGDIVVADSEFDPGVRDRAGSTLANRPAVSWYEHLGKSIFVVAYRGSDEQVSDEASTRYSHEVFVRRLVEDANEPRGVTHHDTQDRRVSDCSERETTCTDPRPYRGIAITRDSISNRTLLAWNDSTFGPTLGRSISPVLATELSLGPVLPFSDGNFAEHTSLAGGDHGLLAVWTDFFAIQARALNLNWTNLSIVASPAEDKRITPAGDFQVRIMLENLGSERVSGEREDNWRVRLHDAGRFELLDAGGMSGDLQAGLTAEPLRFGREPQTYVLKLRDTQYAGGDADLPLAFDISAVNSHDFDISNNTAGISLVLDGGDPAGDDPDDGSGDDPDDDSGDDSGDGSGDDPDDGSGNEQGDETANAPGGGGGAFGWWLAAFAVLLASRRRRT